MKKQWFHNAIEVVYLNEIFITLFIFIFVCREAQAAAISSSLASSIVRDSPLSRGQAFGRLPMNGEAQARQSAEAFGEGEKEAFPSPIIDADDIEAFLAHKATHKEKTVTFDISDEKYDGHDAQVESATDNKKTVKVYDAQAVSATVKSRVADNNNEKAAEFLHGSAQDNPAASATQHNSDADSIREAAQKKSTYMLWDAVEEGDLQKAIDACRAGADINARDKKNKETALFPAVNSGNMHMVQLLLDKKADVNVLNADDHSPLLSIITMSNLLDKFSQSKSKEMIPLLFAEEEKNGIQTITPLMVCDKRLQYSNIMRRLILAGADTYEYMLDTIESFEMGEIFLDAIGELKKAKKAGAAEFRLARSDLALTVTQSRVAREDLSVMVERSRRIQEKMALIVVQAREVQEELVQVVALSRFTREEFDVAIGHARTERESLSVMVEQARILQEDIARLKNQSEAIRDQQSEILSKARVSQNKEILKGMRHSGSVSAKALNEPFLYRTHSKQYFTNGQSLTLEQKRRAQRLRLPGKK